MTMNNSDIKKQTYVCPEIMIITVDNLISLALESEPPTPGNEAVSTIGDYFSDKPFFT